MCSLSKAEEANRDALAAVVAVQDLIDAAHAGQQITAEDLGKLKHITARTAAHIAMTLLAVHRERPENDRRVVVTEPVRQIAAAQPQAQWDAAREGL